MVVGALVVLMLLCRRGSEGGLVSRVVFVRRAFSVVNMGCGCGSSVKADVLQFFKFGELGKSPRRNFLDTITFQVPASRDRRRAEKRGLNR